MKLIDVKFLMDRYKVVSIEKNSLENIVKDDLYSSIVKELRSNDSVEFTTNHNLQNDPNSLDQICYNAKLMVGNHKDLKELIELLDKIKRELPDDKKDLVYFAKEILNR